MELAVEYKINWKLLNKQKESQENKLDKDFIKANDIQIQKDKHGWYCSARSEMDTYFMICLSKTFDELLNKMLRSFSHANDDGISYLNRGSVCAEADSLDELSCILT